MQTGWFLWYVYKNIWQSEQFAMKQAFCLYIVIAAFNKWTKWYVLNDTMISCFNCNIHQHFTVFYFYSILLAVQIFSYQIKLKSNGMDTNTFLTFESIWTFVTWQRNLNFFVFFFSWVELVPNCSTFEKFGLFPFTFLMWN